MNDRVSSARVAAIFAVAALCAVALILIAWVAIALQTTVQEFYQSNPGTLGAEESREIDRLSTISYLLQGLVAPMAFTTLTAVSVGLVMLAVRWHDRHGGRAPRATDATSST